MYLTVRRIGNHKGMKQGDKKINKGKQKMISGQQNIIKRNFPFVLNQIL